MVMGDGLSTALVCLSCAFLINLLEEETSPDGLSDVCHLVVDGCVFLVALMSFLHLFYAYRAEV